MSDTEMTTGCEIAIIGMAGRFPGAANIAEFWANIRNGTESLSRFDPGPDKLADFVPVTANIDGADCFDAGFFGFSPAEAELLDPQQRIFLECAWHALEDAGLCPGDTAHATGIFAAAGMNGYLANLMGNAELRARVTPYEIFTANDKDFLATRAAYKLGLTGPAITVQTACSSSLVAVHLAAQSLLAGDCDMALAGGVALSRQDGYRALAGSILSPTGQCRAFDATADGTVAGNGVGLVVLKRLEDALRDGNRVDAVLLGSAINNDGGDKASYTAPDVAAQARVIRAAQDAAQIPADTVSYIEAHGTGTALGDPIEIAALTRAFGDGVPRRCALGSVKPNIGHLDTAAGIAGLIKTVCMLRDHVLPASLHFTKPNPKIDFAASPFTVNTVTRPWQADGPRRAGVSSFGIGGTNAHVVLQDAPRDASFPPEGPQIIQVSARTPAALTQAQMALADALEQTSAPMPDIAHTLQSGRRTFACRSAIVASTGAEAAGKLRRATCALAVAEAQAVFLLPGQGSQHIGMGRALCNERPEFATWIDRAANHLGPEFRTQMLHGPLDQTQNVQPALFVVEYALAQIWIGMGVTPAALLGHSLGELTAAALAGVMTFETALDMVALRGRLMQAAPAGAMLAVTAKSLPPLPEGVEIAARNGPGLVTLSGSEASIASVQRDCADRGLPCTRLHTAHGFHSAAMQNAATAFTDAMAQIPLAAPRLPMLSNVTGTWLSAAEATDPAYWGQQLRQPVQFDAGVAEVLAMDAPVTVECGPGSVLTGLMQHQGAERCVPGLASPEEGTAALLERAARFWTLGGAPDVTAIAPPGARPVSLPGYPFARERHWIEPDETAPFKPAPASPTPAKPALAGEVKACLPAWQRAAEPVLQNATRQGWLIFDACAETQALAQAIERSGGDVWRVRHGAGFSEPGYRLFTVSDQEDMTRLLATLTERAGIPAQIVFGWGLGHPVTDAQTALIALIAALARTPAPTCLGLLTKGAADVTGHETSGAEMARLHGVLQVAGQEYPWLGARIFDLDPDAPDTDARWLAAAITHETAPISARRGRRHWHLTHQLQALGDPAKLRKSACYVVVGHVARGIGKIWAHRLQNAGVRLAVIEDHSADPLPPQGAALHLRADCTDAEALGAALDEVAQKLGRIEGVFLSTPFSDADITAPLALTGPDQITRAHRTRTAPLEALASALAPRRIGFAMVQSSLSSQLGGIGLAAYAGAHLQTDRRVAELDRTHRADWYAVGFDALAGDTASRAGVLEQFALSADQVWDMTLRLLGARLTGHCALSRGDIDARRTEWLSPQPVIPAETTAGLKPRPEISTPFVAPRNDLETQVAHILAGLLGLQQIGAEDGFFELGGHSLLAIRAIAQLREAFPVPIEMRELLTDNPSPASIAALISGKLNENETLASLLGEISQMSDDDIAAALAEEGAT